MNNYTNFFFSMYVDAAVMFVETSAKESQKSVNTAFQVCIFLQVGPSQDHTHYFRYRKDLRGVGALICLSISRIYLYAHVLT